MKFHAVIAIVLFSWAGLAGAAKPDDQGCRRCDQRGVVECPEHDDEMHAFEGRVEFCSTIAGCQTCGGTLRIDCKHCDGGPESDLVAPRRKAIAAWMAKDKMSPFLKRRVPRVETTRFQLIIDTGSLKRGKKTIDAHTIMHLVADDVESVRSMVAEHFGITSKDYFNKMRMWIWDNPEDHIAVMREFLGSSSTGDFKLLGKDPVFSVWTERSFKSVPGVRRIFTHNSAHMLLSNAFKMLWTGDTGGGFFDAGLAHWYEYKIHELSVNYCIEEATLALDYNGGEWRAPIRKRLKKDDRLMLPRLLRLNTGAMELPDQALCWSFFDWLVAVHPDKLGALQKGLKQKLPGRDVLEEVLGLKVIKLEEEWRAWVKEIYPLKGDKPRTPKKKKKKKKR